MLITDEVVSNVPNPYYLFLKKNIVEKREITSIEIS